MSMISLCNYEFQGQVYSPAFSDPPLSPPSSPMSTSSDSEHEPEIKSEPRHVNHYYNKKPKFPTIYHERLQPLQPMTTLKVATMTSPSSIIPSHHSEVKPQVQQQFLNVVRIGEAQSVETFLRQFSENIDINRYSSEGQTPLHEACVEGNLALVKVLVKFGADVRLTNRDGFSLIHLASFSRNPELVNYLFSLKKIR